MMTLAWLASLVMRDASIVDAFWGLRLSLHALWRSRGRGEDYRYREMRERNPARGSEHPGATLTRASSVTAAILGGSAVCRPISGALEGCDTAGRRDARRADRTTFV
jgi:hypothetical protein